MSWALGFPLTSSQQEQDFSLFSAMCRAQAKGALTGQSWSSIWEDLGLIHSTREEALSTTPVGTLHSEVKLYY